MTLTTHTVTLETEFPGGAPLDGTWTLSVVADPPLLMDTDGHVVFAGKTKRDTTSGRLVFTLPATGQANLDPPEALWQIQFESKDKSAKLGPFVFDLDHPKTLDDIAEATGIPITPSLLFQTMTARDEAVEAAGVYEALEDRVTDLESGPGSPITSVNGETGAVVLDAADVGAAPALASTSAVASGRTLALGDAGKVLETTSGTGLTLTVPTNASVAFPIGTLIEVYQSAAGQVTLVGSGAVTLRSRGGALKTAGQYATVGIRKRATDEWVVAGDLAV